VYGHRLSPELVAPRYDCLLFGVAMPAGEHRGVQELHAALSRKLMELEVREERLLESPWF
jgi:hypothetical protein